MVGRYMDNLNKDEVISEGLDLIYTSKRNPKKVNNQNEWREIFLPVQNNSLYSDFYFGRCLQFLLDSNNKKSMKVICSQEIIGEARRIRTKHLTPKKGTELHHECCNNCSTWTLGEKRCDCDNVRCTVYFGSVSELDDTEISIEISSY
jgi:hypothetical protein